jgi:GNAT superfamily N-acetyltransferase
LADAESLMQIINAAFIVERIAIDGDRIDLEGVRLLLSKGSFLIAESVASPAESLGCVYVEPRGDRCYLGLLSVLPSYQGRGVGKQLAAASEDFARAAGCSVIELRIISPRAADLLPLYAKLGYTEAGTSAFPADVITKIPCHFIAMTKLLNS